MHHAADLEPYGAWAYDTGLSSWYWRPHATVAWTPYRYGRWVYTYGGWSWVPSAPWGYVTTHYGRWHHTGYNGWAWYPGSVWTHASVHWYVGPRYVGWVPLNYYGRPAVSFSVHFGGRTPTYDYGRRGVSVGKTGSAFGGRAVNRLGYRAGSNAWTVVPQDSFGSANTARRAIARNALPADLDRSSRVLLSGPLRARQPGRLTPTARTAVSRNGYRATGIRNRRKHHAPDGRVTGSGPAPRHSPADGESDLGAPSRGAADAHCQTVIVIFPLPELRQALDRYRSGTGAQHDSFGDSPDCQPGTTSELDKTVIAWCTCSSPANGCTTAVLASGGNGAPQSLRFATFRQPSFRKPSIGPPALGFGAVASPRTGTRPHRAPTSGRVAAGRI